MHVMTDSSGERRRERAQLSGLVEVGVGLSSLGRVAPPAAGLLSGELKGFVFPSAVHVLRGTAVRGTASAPKYSLSMMSHRHSGSTQQRV